MREILFRGKRLDNGEWVEGHLIQYEDGRARICESHTEIFCYEKDHSVIQTVAHEVDPPTVCQYTGLKDKNGKRIFEGDIVRTDKFSEPNKQYIIEYDLQFGAFIGQDRYNLYFVTFDGDIGEFEIIGNIHDNPELLEK